jgi:mannose-1-phosphate guanylyltransferase
VLHEDPDATMLVLPADHVIQPIEAFEQAARRAAELLIDDGQRLVLFGVVPTFPSTGFGYIERGEPLSRENAAFAVAAFREKPDRATAEAYLRAGRFYWNCGIFVWRAQRILDALREFEPDMGRLTDQIASAIGTPSYEATVADVFPRMKSISIDYAVLERDRSIVVLEAPFGWDDVGSWEALPRLSGSDTEGNTVQGLHCGVDTRQCIIRSTPDHLVATLGLEDCIIVHTPDATFVARRGDENAIKQLVSALNERGLGHHL